MNILDLHQRFLRYCAIEEGLSKNTLNDLKSKIQTFVKRTELIETSDITIQIVKNFFYEGQERYQWSFSTYDNYHKYLKKFFAWCVKCGHIKENHILSIGKPPRPKRIPRRLTEEQIFKILSNAYSMPCRYEYEQFRNYAIIATYTYSGLRLAELTNLRMTDLDLESEVIFISQGKGKKDRYVPIHYKLKQILRQYLNVRKKSGKQSIHLFTGARSNKPLTHSGIKGIYQKIRKVSNVHFTTHQLRHTFASKAVEQNLPLPILQQILGHSNIQSTMIYLKMSPKALSEGLNALELF